ncbi:hypothetical protein DOTSEDRAFT_29590 [Dothistroma septosporum NZE10]|uniref:Uncharacterized protein n=1 Tax=Dothistroma septosporum (strain NZE10 / CBS 128990) TaxID=675120 RepID=N1PBR3_DOTSN|nr:hypothetical protein DOTSEDRAFT_29590 [Dothistroma septosporum NZE10]
MASLPTESPCKVVIEPDLRDHMDGKTFADLLSEPIRAKYKGWHEVKNDPPELFRQPEEKYPRRLKFDSACKAVLQYLKQALVDSLKSAQAGAQPPL